MIGKIIGAAVGLRLAGRHEGGRGMLLRALARVVAKRAFGALGLAVAGGDVAKKLRDRRNRVRQG